MPQHPVLSFRSRTRARLVISSATALALVTTLLVFVSPAASARGESSDADPHGTGCSIVARATRAADTECLERGGGTSAGTRDDRETAAPTQAAEGAPKLALRESTETIKAGGAVLTPLSYGDTEALVQGHQYGSVVATTKSGEVLWERHGMSLRDDWNLPPVQHYYPPWMLMGPVPGWTDRSNSEQPLATFDATNDGFEDVVVAHNQIEARREGPSFSTGVVSLLDGRSGETLWFREFRGYVPTIALSGETIVVAHESGPPTPGNPGDPEGRSELIAIRFTGTGGAVSGSQAWRISTDTEWARWTGPIDMGGGRVAVAWTAPDATDSTLMVLDVADGSAIWTSLVADGVRLLRHDDAGEELIAASRASRLPDSFNVVAFRSSDGTVRATSEPLPGTARELQIGDAGGDGVADWVYSRDLFADGLRSRSRVGLIDGATALTLWERNVGRSSLPEPLDATEPLLPVHSLDSMQADGFVVTDGLVHVASQYNDGSTLLSDLTALDATTGNEVWSDGRDWPASPQSLLLDELDGRTVLFGMSNNGALLAYTPGDGSLEMHSSQLTNIQAVVAAQVDGKSGEDLIVGSFSGGVYALDSAQLRREQTPAFWRATTAGPVHDLHLADVNGDAAPEVVVAAEREVVVLDLSSGAAIARIPFPDDYVWTVSIADADGDGKDDVIVPTTRLSAHRGSDGSLLWEWKPEVPADSESFFSSVGISDNAVVGQFAIERRLGDDEVSETAAGTVRGTAGPPVPPGAAGVDLSSGQLLWETRMASTVDRVALWRSVAPTSEWPGADGDAVALFRYETGELTRASIQMVKARTGELLESPSGYDASLFTGVETLSTGELMLYHWNSFAKATPGSILIYPARGRTTYDGMSVALGDGKTLIALSANNSVALLERGAFETQQPFVTALAPPLVGGDMIVADLDADGRDEIITFQHDFEAHDTVLGFQGGFLSFFDGLGRGLMVMETGPPRVDPLPGEALTSLVTSQALVDLKEPFTLSGVVQRTGACTGPLQVKVDRVIAGRDESIRLDSVAVDETGAWTLDVKAMRNATYSARVTGTATCIGLEPATTEVLVKVKIAKLKIPKKCGVKRVVRGRVEPDHPDTKVTLRRKARGRWVLVDSDRLGRSSRFELKTKECGRYRIRWPRQSIENEAGALRFRMRD